jgi:hypothetical protein
LLGNGVVAKRAFVQRDRQQTQHLFAIPPQNSLTFPNHIGADPHIYRVCFTEIEEVMIRRLIRCEYGVNQRAANPEQERSTLHLFRASGAVPPASPPVTLPCR